MILRSKGTAIVPIKGRASVPTVQGMGGPGVAVVLLLVDMDANARLGNGVQLKSNWP
jgi:hypothetical protein